jgi:hypothetical protein
MPQPRSAAQNVAWANHVARSRSCAVLTSQCTVHYVNNEVITSKR